MKNLCIAVDFDGTCITNDFPKEGKDIGAAKVLKRITDAGHDLILFTCRQNHAEDRMIEFNDDKSIYLPAGNHLSDAIYWFNKNNIPLFDINHNPYEDEYDTDKPHFDLLIDDKALGVPLTKYAIVDGSVVFSKNKFVDWMMVEMMLEHNNII
jgi:hypothetical protein